jgi:biopolymer transport protein ExbB
MEGLHELISALRLGGAVMVPLLALAVAATVVVLEKAYLLVTRTRVPMAIPRLLATPDFVWDELEDKVRGLGARNYFRRFLGVILAHRNQPSWWVESRATEEAGDIEKSLGRWLWVLETIVTAAPLLGLLGTISGMIRSFKLFGQEGLVDPRGVTGGVAEALIATAVGLFIALIALFAFNFFSYRQAQVMDEMEQFGTRLVDAIRLQEEKQQT